MSVLEKKRKCIASLLKGFNPADDCQRASAE
jgi:hypothetical protein